MDPDGGSQRKHRKAKSWDSGDSYHASVSRKSCLPVPALFRRTKGKVMSVDVASLSNASDTVVPVEQECYSGRQIHEAAKAALNDGKYADAISLFEAIQKAQVARFGEDHVSVGAAMHNVGVVRLRMEQHKEAEKILNRAVGIRRVVLGSDHLELAASLAKLGSARVALHKFDDALGDLRESLRINRNTLGRSHKTVAQVLCHIACLYFEAGELLSAQATFEDALEIYREVFQTAVDRDSCMTQMTDALCNIGSIHNKRKNFEQAIQCFKEGLDVSKGRRCH
jgi:tetratricopeptide (TPR) repeat protein